MSSSVSAADGATITATANIASISKLLNYVQSCARNDISVQRGDPPEKAAALALRDALFTGAAKLPVGMRKRRRIDESLANRPCSPTLFSGSSSGTVDVVKRQELGEQLESTLGEAVRPFYTRPPSAPSESDTRLIPAHRYSSLGYLLLPIRRTSTLERWTPHDIAVFEAALCTHGKKFDIIQTLLPNKETKEIIDFYYVWKNTSHKQVWKKTFKEIVDDGL